ncbi:MAG: Alkaline phosphatase (EC [uncultured Sulfurovum sp.]|uniref:Alkaline phosphatase (EC) n=1 Tax=uncultured Sulfurovum sp. TaxID=269237 RepID=A0A6S6TG21_9BACT|nr:MAG: Alkaline phosphatase (EC [uncultured Sulfurovum sp.]
MYSFKTLAVLLLSSTIFAQANSCPKWLIMPIEGGVNATVPIYDVNITGPDMDCDTILDAIDTDIDGDGVDNTTDTFPLDSTESIDTDGDGLGNNADTDDDNDGFLDTDEIAVGSDPLDPNVLPVYGELTKLSAYETSVEGGSEIVAYDKTSKRMFTTNGADNAIDIIDIANTVNPTKVSSIDLTPYGTGVNSVAVQNGIVAVAVQDGNATVGNKQLKGSIVLFNIDGVYQQTIVAGYLPDMVTFNEDGTKLIVANEGEPNNDYSIDPIGSIGIATIATGAYIDINFSSISLTNATDGTTVRLGDTPSNNKAQDLEPEYITVSGNYAYVTLQENNAMAKVNLTTNSLEYVKSYGAKSWEISSGNTIDIEEEGVINMKSYAGLFGLYQPDSIASYKINTATYLVTANEGDGRGYGNFEDEKKISKLDLDTSIASEYVDENDLKVMVDLGDTDNDGDYDKLYTYGARSFSIWDENGNLVWDSGDEISKKVAELQPTLFNKDEDEIDKRSGNKGAEPEALTVGTIGYKTLAFIGLERQDTIMIYDITNPNAPIFSDYIMTSSDGTTGDISPEGMKFISADESPDGKNLLLVSFEVSGSTVIYEVK